MLEEIKKGLLSGLGAVFLTKEKIERIVEAGRLAPSACNAQPWKFIVVTNPLILKEVTKAASEPVLKMNLFVDQAPVIIVVVREKPNISSNIGGKILKKDYSSGSWKIFRMLTGIKLLQSFL